MTIFTRFLFLWSCIISNILYLDLSAKAAKTSSSSWKRPIAEEVNYKEDVQSDKKSPRGTHISGEVSIGEAIMEELDALDGSSGDEIFALVIKHAESGDALRCAEYFRKAIYTDRLGEKEDISVLLQRFIDTHRRKQTMWLGLMLLAELYWAGNLKQEARDYADAAIKQNQSCAECYVLRAEISERDPDYVKRYYDLKGDLESAAQSGWHDARVLKRVGEVLLDTLVYDKANQFLTRSFELDSSRSNWGAAVSGIFARHQVAEWGPDGSQYPEDMRLTESIIREEIKTTYKRGGTKQISVFNPANLLPLPIDPMLKLAATQSHARGEQFQSRSTEGFVEVSHSEKIPRIRKDMQRKNFRIRIGYVSANINARTTTYMAQNVLAFHDKSRFEVHIYATTPNDSDQMINVKMRGVNWRKKVQNSVEYFHEVIGIKVIDLYNMILQHDIHILINWDGFSNAGIRIGGIFSLNPAPIQINHQEYIGTMGADYIHYFISDNITTPEKYRKYFSEKMILMPHTFLATSMAYLGPEMNPPAKATPRPELNGCHGAPASFTFCNMNKHMKFTPDLVREWVKILEAVPNSVLCLLENPPQAQDSIRAFLRGLNDSLQSQVRYSPFIVNPYDNQQRVKDQCNVILDTPIYSGHTTNADALWGGVPVVTFGTSKEACGRVGQSMLTTLGLPELIAANQSQYNDIAIRLATNKTFYHTMRRRLVSTCLQTSPPHPYWDLRRYTAALETGFEMAFHRYIDGQFPHDIVVSEEFDTVPDSGSRGSSNKIYNVNPAMHIPVAFLASCSDRSDASIRVPYSSSGRDLDKKDEPLFVTSDRDDDGDEDGNENNAFNLKEVSKKIRTSKEKDDDATTISTSDSDTDVDDSDINVDESKESRQRKTTKAKKSKKSKKRKNRRGRRSKGEL